jgi:hypothetical protein
MLHHLQFNFFYFYFNKMCDFSKLTTCKYKGRTIILQNLQFVSFLLCRSNVMFIISHILDTNVSDCVRFSSCQTKRLTLNN